MLELCATSAVQHDANKNRHAHQSCTRCKPAWMYNIRCSSSHSAVQRYNTHPRGVRGMRRSGRLRRRWLGGAPLLGLHPKLGAGPPNGLLAPAAPPGPAAAAAALAAALAVNGGRLRRFGAAWKMSGTGCCAHAPSLASLPACAPGAAAPNVKECSGTAAGAAVAAAGAAGAEPAWPPAGGPAANATGVAAASPPAAPNEKSGDRGCAALLSLAAAGFLGKGSGVVLVVVLAANVNASGAAAAASLKLGAPPAAPAPAVLAAPKADRTGSSRGSDARTSQKVKGAADAAAAGAASRSLVRSTGLLAALLAPPLPFAALAAPAAAKACAVVLAAGAADAPSVAAAAGAAPSGAGAAVEKKGRPAKGDGAAAAALNMRSARCVRLQE